MWGLGPGGLPAPLTHPNAAAPIRLRDLYFAFGGIEIEVPTCAEPSPSLCSTLQRDPEVFFWPSAFLDAWGTKAKKLHIFKNTVVFGPRRLRLQYQRTLCS